MILSSPITATIGFHKLIGVSGAGATLTATGAATPIIWAAFGFTAPETGNIAKITARISAGSTGATTFSLYTSLASTGKPNTLIGVVASGLTLVSNTTQTITLSGAAVTAGVRYHLVMKSAELGQNPAIQAQVNGLVATNDHSTCLSTNADVWGTLVTGRNSFIYEMENGNTFGAVVFSATSTAATLAAGYERGSRFTSPPVWFACDSAHILAYRIATPTGTIAAKLYVNGVLKSTSPNMSVDDLPTAQGLILFTLQKVVIPPNSDCRIVISHSDAQSTTNYVRTFIVATYNTSAFGMPLSSQLCTATSAGGVWTDTQNAAVPFMLSGSLQAGSEFPAPPLNRRQFNSQR